MADNPRLKAEDVEFGLPRPNYTAHTMDFLRRATPSGSFASSSARTTCGRCSSGRGGVSWWIGWDFWSIPGPSRGAKRKPQRAPSPRRPQHRVESRPDHQHFEHLSAQALANGDSARYLLPDGQRTHPRKGLYGFTSSRTEPRRSGVVEGVHGALKPDEGKGAHEGQVRSSRSSSAFSSSRK